MMNVKEELTKYYVDNKRLNKYKYELKILKDNLEDVEKHLEDNCSEPIKKIVSEKKKIVLEKRMKIVELSEEISGFDFCIDSLEEQDKLLLQYRFSKKSSYNEIELKLNMSRSTIYRRIERILDEIQITMV